MYIVRLFKDQAAAPQEQWVAYNVPPEESDLKTATNAEILRGSPTTCTSRSTSRVRHNGLKDTARRKRRARYCWFCWSSRFWFEQLFAHRLSYLPSQAGGTDMSGSILHAGLLAAGRFAAQLRVRLAGDPGAVGLDDGRARGAGRRRRRRLPTGYARPAIAAGACS